MTAYIGFARSGRPLDDQVTRVQAGDCFFCFSERIRSNDDRFPRNPACYAGHGAAKNFKPAASIAPRKSAFRKPVQRLPDGLSADGALRADVQIFGKWFLRHTTPDLNRAGSLVKGDNFTRPLHAGDVNNIVMYANLEFLLWKTICVHKGTFFLYGLSLQAQAGDTIQVAQEFLILFFLPGKAVPPLGFIFTAMELQNGIFSKSPTPAIGEGRRFSVDYGGVIFDCLKQ
jgi:hypothetical protein